MLHNQDFTRERTKYLGGSDIGAILGLSKYRSAVDVWMEKTGKTVSLKDSLPLRFGQFAEDFVAREYALATGYALIKHEKAMIHPQYAYMQGHIDRLVAEERGALMNAQGQARRILECKTANPFAQSDWGEIGTDQVPLTYLVQCAWYMMLSNIDQTDLAVLFGNADFRIYAIQRDAELEQMIFERAIDFWGNHVVKDIPPKAVSELDYQQLFRQSSPSKTIEADSETAELIQKLGNLNQHIAQYELEVSQMKQGIMARMQDAEVLKLQGKTLATWRAPKPTLRIDSKRLTEEHPDLVALYQVPIQNSRRLVIKPLPI